MPNKKGVETGGISGLYGFVLLIVMVGMIIGVGILVMDKFGGSTYYSGTDYNDTVTVANYTAQKLDWGNVTFSSIYANGTSVPSSCYSINTTEGSFIYTNDTAVCDVIQGDNFGVVYDYKNYATATRDATGSVVTEIAGIATDWIGLIITVAILAIILALVLVAFRPGMNR